MGNALSGELSCSRTGPVFNSADVNFGALQA